MKSPKPKFNECNKPSKKISPWIIFWRVLFLKETIQVLFVQPFWQRKNSCHNPPALVGVESTKVHQSLGHGFWFTTCRHDSMHHLAEVGWLRNPASRQLIWCKYPMIYRVSPTCQVVDHQISEPSKPFKAF